MLKERGRDRKERKVIVPSFCAPCDPCLALQVSMFAENIMTIGRYGRCFLQSEGIYVG